MILAIIQARMNSTRLPGKVLRKVNDIPLLEYLYERVRTSKKINKYIIATTTDISDNSIEDFAKGKNIECYRGSIDNVLKRYYFCAKEFMLSNELNNLDIVRITGDCPVIDPKVIDEVINYYENNNCNYVSNTLIPTYPDGMDIEVFDFRSLEIAYKNATLKSEMEHVTLYIKNNIEFSKLNYASEHNFSHLRLTVDEEEDFLLIKILIDKLFEDNKSFSYLDAISMMTKTPKLLSLNSSIERDEGLFKSLKEDEKFNV
jgi:spore coat polysaccharide biosynthesis protein SpsF